MSQHPYGYGGYPHPPHGYQQYFQQQQQQQPNSQHQSQQALPQMWHHQQPQQQYMHKESRTLNTSMPGLLPPGISVVRDPPSFAQTAPHPSPRPHPQRSSPGVRIQSSSAAPPPPLISKPQFTPSNHFPTSTQGEHEMETTTATKPKQYKPLVKHFANRDEPGFDLSRVKTEPDLLLKGPPSLTLRPTPPAPPSLIPATSSITSSPSLVSTTSSRTQVTQSTPVSGPSTLQEGGLPPPSSNSDSAAPHSSSLSSDVDGSRHEQASSASKTHEESSVPGGNDSADSTLKIDTVNGETEEGDCTLKQDEQDEGLPDTASDPGHQSIDFFSNLKNPVVGKDTLCIFCIQNCFDKDPKLLNCLHTSCSSCLEKKFKESAKHQRGEVVLDLEVGETIQSERSVFCPVCKIKTFDNEIAQNLIIVTADQNVEGEDSEGQICNSCDEGNTSTQWCKDCKEYLCEDCVKAHQRVKMTKDHVLKLVLSTKKQLSSSSSSVPSLEAFKICSLHSNEYLDYYCDTCEKLTCRNCQLSPNHQGHSYRSSRDAVVDFKFKLRQIISDVKLKRNSLEENRALLKNKLIEVDIKEKSLLTQLKDVQHYLVHKIESRFKELIKEASQTILDKQKAINSRRSTLDRLFQQTEHSLAFVDHMLHFTSKEQCGEDLGILSAKRSVERQLRRLKKTDTSTGLTDQTSSFKLDAYFQQYSGAAMHEGLNSCLKQMLADVKVLNAPPQPPVEAKPPVASVIDTNVLKTQKVVIKRTGESPVTPGNRLAQRIPVAKAPSPLSMKRGGSSTARGAGRGLVSAANTGRGGGRGSGAKASPLSAVRGGRGVSLTSGRGGVSARGAKAVSAQGGRGGVARGGITNSVRAKTLAPNQVVGNLKGVGPGMSVVPSRAVGRGSPSTANSHQRIQLSTTTSPQLKAGVIPKQISILQHKNAQQQNVRNQAAVTSIHSQVQKQAQSIASRPPVLQQMTQITVTPSNSNRPQQQRWNSNNNSARDWSHQQQQQRQQQLMQDQQQNSYFVAAYGQQATTVHPVNQQQQHMARSVPPPNTAAPSPNSSWHSPQIEVTPSGPSQATNSSGQSDTSYKITLPSISKSSFATSTPIKPNNNSLMITSVKKEVLDLNEAPPSSVEVVKDKPPEVSQNQKSPDETSTANSNLETEKAPDKTSDKIETEQPEPVETDPLSMEAPASGLDNPETTVSNTTNNKDEKSLLVEDNLVAVKDEQDDSNAEAEDWCAICHDGGDVQYCCDRCPKVYHLYCYIPRLTDEPPDDWVCLMCATVDEIYQYSNTVEKGNMGERDLMISRRLLFELFNQYPQSSSFKDCADLNFPEYLEVVKEPIALDIIRDRLDVDNPDQYSRIEEFLSDVRRMFKNCYSFHDRESQWYQHAKELEEILDLKLEEWIPELAYDQTVISAKTKRKRSAAELASGSSSPKKRKNSNDTEQSTQPNDTESEKESSSKKKKKKKSKAKDDELSDEIVGNGDQDERDEDSESLSEGEKLDYLDNLEARLNRVKKMAEDDGSGSSKASTGGSKKGRGRGGRRGRAVIKLKVSK